VEKAVELYQAGCGLKRISALVGMPTNTIKRHLIKMGCYEGVHHRQPEPVAEVVRDPTNPTTWLTEEADIRQDGPGCWIFELHGLFSCCSVPLPTDCIGRVITWAASFSLINPAAGSCEIGLSDQAGCDTIGVILQRHPVLLGSQWHVVRHVRAPEPRLWLKGNQCNPQVIRVSDILTNVRKAEVA
jgi:hypothetical protein